MLLNSLTSYVEQNFHRIISGEYHFCPKKLFSMIVSELAFSDEQIKRLSENEYLKWYQNIFHLKFLEDLLHENFVELILHSNSEAALFHLNSPPESKKIQASDRLVNLALEILAYRSKTNFSYEMPFASFEKNIFELSLRVTLAHSCILNSSSHKAYIRKLGSKAFTFKSFTAKESNLHFLDITSNKKYNIVISGATASGKTSLIRSYLNSIDLSEHTIILEDTNELNLRSKGTTHLLARPGEKEDLKKFCTSLLRMRPDRIILGEIRSSEVVPLILNLNCGHKGLLTTVHANNAKDALYRLATLFAIYSEGIKIDYEQILSLISSNIDFVVHMEKGQISEIIRVVSSEKDKVIFENI